MNNNQWARCSQSYFFSEANNYCNWFRKQSACSIRSAQTKTNFNKVKKNTFLLVTKNNLQRNIICNHSTWQVLPMQTKQIYIKKNDSLILSVICLDVSMMVSCI